MTFTKADLEQTVSGRKSADLPVVEGWQDGALTVFVPGRPSHLKGKSQWWQQHKHTSAWRERAASRLVAHRPDLRGSNGHTIGARRVGGWPWTPEQRKLVAFTVYCRNPFDGDDNLRLVCSPVKDALMPNTPKRLGVGLIDDDKDSSNHTFVYRQVTSRKAGAIYGIAIRIALARPTALSEDAGMAPAGPVS